MRFWMNLLGMCLFLSILGIVLAFLLMYYVSDDNVKDPALYECVEVLTITDIPQTNVVCGRVVNSQEVTVEQFK